MRKQNILSKWMKASSLIAILFISSCTYMGWKTIPVQDLESKYQNANSRYIDLDNLKVHYRDEGEGPTLLLIHNELGSLHSWDGWVKVLKDDFRIVRLDLPGFGLTGSAGLEDYGRSATVDFISRFIEALDLQDINIVGASYGGFTAWNYTLDNPDNVNKLILLSPVGYTQKMPTILKMFTLPGVEASSKVTSIPKPAIREVLKLAYGSNKRITKEIVTRYHQLLLREGNTESAAKFCKVLKEHSKNKHLGIGIKDISVPTFILWGEQDKWTPIKYLDLWIEDIADAEFMRYPSVGHYPHEEIPNISAQDTRDFINGELAKFPGT